MAQASPRAQTPAAWEKSAAQVQRSTNSGRWKFIVGGLLILGAVAYLIITNTLGGARYFITVDELLANREAYAGQTVRITGAVIGESIVYDAENLLITFTVANVPEQFDDLATALHDAVHDPNATRLNVRVENQVKPELLQHEAQAIMTGTLGEDGVFHVSELNLKCPSRFIEAGPEQAIAEPAV